MAKIQTEQTKEQQKLILNLQTLEYEARRQGLQGTGRAINEAIRKVGWEIADKSERGK